MRRQQKSRELDTKKLIQRIERLEHQLRNRGVDPGPGVTLGNGRVIGRIPRKGLVSGVVSGVGVCGVGGVGSETLILENDNGNGNDGIVGYEPSLEPITSYYEQDQGGDGGGGEGGGGVGGGGGGDFHFIRERDRNAERLAPAAEVYVGGGFAAAGSPGAIGNRPHHRPSSASGSGPGGSRPGSAAAARRQGVVHRPLTPPHLSALKKKKNSSVRPSVIFLFLFFIFSFQRRLSPLMSDRIHLACTSV